MCVKFLEQEIAGAKTPLRVLLKKFLENRSKEFWSNKGRFIIVDDICTQIDASRAIGLSSWLPDENCVKKHTDRIEIGPVIKDILCNKLGRGI